jgi:hypothetical protein
MNEQRGLAAEGLGEHFAMLRQCGLVSGAPVLGELREYAAAILLAHRADDKPLILEPADDARQRALTEVDDVGERLHTALGLGLAGKFVENLELADAEPVLPQRPFQRAGHSCVLLEQRAPLIDERAIRSRHDHNSTTGLQL